MSVVSKRRYSQLESGKEIDKEEGARIYFLTFLTVLLVQVVFRLSYVFNILCLWIKLLNLINK